MSVGPSRGSTISIVALRATIAVSYSGEKCQNQKIKHAALDIEL